MDADNALWTFDVNQNLLQHRQSTGCLPVPALCIGMDVVGDCLYVLVNHHDDTAQDPDDPDYTRCMEVYSLDLKTWLWTQMPSQEDAPVCACGTEPTFVQVGNDRCNTPFMYAHALKRRCQNPTDSFARTIDNTA